MLSSTRVRGPCTWATCPIAPRVVQQEEIHAMEQDPPVEQSNELLKPKPRRVSSSQSSFCRLALTSNDPRLQRMMDSMDQLHLWIDALSTHVDTRHHKFTKHVDARFQSQRATRVPHLMAEVLGCFQLYTPTSIWFKLLVAICFCRSIYFCTEVVLVQFLMYFVSLDVFYIFISYIQNRLIIYGYQFLSCLYLPCGSYFIMHFVNFVTKRGR